MTDIPPPDRRIAFTLTPEDYLGALRTTARALSRKPLSIAVFLFFLLLFLASLIFPRPPIMGIVPLPALLFLPLTIAPINYFLYLPWQARKVFRQQKSLHREINAAWSEKGYGALNVPAEADPLSILTPWQDYAFWRENETIVLLYHSDAMFQMLPKRALSTEQLRDLRDCARRAGLKGA